jgi:hypothetical protein
MSSLSDHRSAHIRQRWVELENVGSVEIPAFGVCEITGSYRPDTGGLVTPGGGRTVMRVRRPETDDPCAVIVNGPCPIPVGENGRPGTKDDPLLALVDSNYDAGTALGVEKESFVLTERTCARYVVDGDYDAGTSTQRVDRYDDCPNEIMVRNLTVCAKPGTGSTGQPQKWDDDAEDYVDDLNRDPVHIIDPLCWRMAMYDDKYKVEREHCTGKSSGYYRPSMPYGLIRMVKITEQIPCNGSGTGKVLVNKSAELGGTPDCGWDELDDECEITVCNTTNRTIACDTKEEIATAVFMPGECIAFLIANHRPLLAATTLSASMCGTSVEVNEPQWLDACEWENKTAGPRMAENQAGIYGCEGDNVIVFYYEENGVCKLGVLQAQEHDLGRPMHDIKCGDGTCTVDMTRLTSSMYGHQCENCGATEDAATQLVGEEVDIEFLSIDCDSESETNCQLTKVIQTICVFCSSSSQTAGTPLSLVEINSPTGLSVTKQGAGTGGESCEFRIATSKVCVLGCNTGESGDDISLELTRVDPLTDVDFGTSVGEGGTGGDDPAAICLTPSTTAMYVIACVGDEEEGTPQCIDLTVCPPEEA